MFYSPPSLLLPYPPPLLPSSPLLPSPPPPPLLSSFKEISLLRKLLFCAFFLSHLLTFIKIKCETQNKKIANFSFSFLSCTDRVYVLDSCTNYCVFNSSPDLKTDTYDYFLFSLFEFPYANKYGKK